MTSAPCPLACKDSSESRSRRVEVGRRIDCGIALYHFSRVTALYLVLSSISQSSREILHISTVKRGRSLISGLYFNNFSLIMFQLFVVHDQPPIPRDSSSRTTELQYRRQQECAGSGTAPLNPDSENLGECPRRWSQGGARDWEVYKSKDDY